MQSRLFKIIAAAGCALAATPAAAKPDWRYVGHDGPDAVRYLDAGSISRSGDVVAFWMMIARGPERTDVSELLVSAHCERGAFRVLRQRDNPRSTLRQPSWVVQLRRGWQSFDEAVLAPPSDPLRALIDMACGKAEIGPVPGAQFAIKPPEPEPTPPELAETPAPVEAPAPSELGQSPVASALNSSGPAAWVDLGASLVGQAIMIDAARIANEAVAPEAWFRLTNPDEDRPTPVAYLLRVDCKARTITQLGLRKFDSEGRLEEEKELLQEAEKPIAVEGETVMEIAHTALCTGKRADGVRELAGLRVREEPPTEAAARE